MTQEKKKLKLNPADLVTGEGREDKIQALLETKKPVPPIVVFRDISKTGDVVDYVVEGTNRTIAAKKKGVPEIEAEVIEDESYKVGKVSVLTLVLTRVFGIRNKK